jgi:hypothetical protein
MEVRFVRFTAEDMMGVERSESEDSLGENFTTFTTVTSADICYRKRAVIYATNVRTYSIYIS